MPSRNLPAISLVAVPGRRRQTLDLAREIEGRGFAGIYIPSRFGNMAQCTALAVAAPSLAEPQLLPQFLHLGHQLLALLAGRGLHLLPQIVHLLPGLMTGPLSPPAKSAARESSRSPPFCTLAP